MGKQFSLIPFPGDQNGSHFAQASQHIGPFLQVAQGLYKRLTATQSFFLPYSDGAKRHNRNPPVRSAQASHARERASLVFAKKTTLLQFTVTQAFAS